MDNGFTDRTNFTSGEPSDPNHGKVIRFQLVLSKEQQLFTVWIWLTQLANRPEDGTLFLDYLAEVIGQLPSAA